MLEDIPFESLELGTGSVLGIPNTRHGLLLKNDKQLLVTGSD